MKIPSQKKRASDLSQLCSELQLWPLPPCAHQHRHFPKGPWNIPSFRALLHPLLLHNEKLLERRAAWAEAGANAVLVCSDSGVFYPPVLNLQLILQARASFSCTWAQCPDRHDIGLGIVLHYVLWTEMVTVCGGPLEENLSTRPPRACSAFNSVRPDPWCSSEAHEGRIWHQGLAGGTVTSADFPLVRIHDMIKPLGAGTLYINFICRTLSSA